MKRAILFGSAAAGGAAAWTLLEYLLGFHTSRMEVGRYTGFVGIIFPILAITGAIRAARRACEGRLGFTQGMLVGAAVTLVLSLLGALFFSIYFSAINPAFLAANSALGSERSAAGQVSMAFFASLISGMIISAAVAAVMRRETATPSERPSRSMP